MTRTHFSRSVEISAPLQVVWQVMVDVERWPEWTTSVSRVKRLTPDPLTIGSRVRIHQPKLPPASWRVTELASNSGFTWISRAPGLLVTARHTVDSVPSGTRVSLSIRYEGPFGRLLARWVGELNDNYLEKEATGLNARCLEYNARPTYEHEIH